MAGDERVRHLADLLHEAGEVHHVVFADTDGADDDWATFYSNWLLAHTALATLLERRPIRSHLTRDLVVCDEEYTAGNIIRNRGRSGTRSSSLQNTANEHRE